MTNGLLIILKTLEQRNPKFFKDEFSNRYYQTKFFDKNKMKKYIT